MLYGVSLLAGALVDLGKDSEAFGVAEEAIRWKRGAG